MAALSLIGGIAFYGVMAAWITSRTYLRRSYKIGTVRPGYTYLEFTAGAVLTFAVIVGVVWPIGVFMLLALNLIDRGEHKLAKREADVAVA